MSHTPSRSSAVRESARTSGRLVSYSTLLARAGARPRRRPTGPAGTGGPSGAGRDQQGVTRNLHRDVQGGDAGGGCAKRAPRRWQSAAAEPVEEPLVEDRPLGFEYAVWSWATTTSSGPGTRRSPEDRQPDGRRHEQPQADPPTSPLRRPASRARRGRPSPTPHGAAPAAATPTGRTPPIAGPRARLACRSRPAPAAWPRADGRGTARRPLHPPHRQLVGLLGPPASAAEPGCCRRP